MKKITLLLTVAFLMFIVSVSAQVIQPTLMFNEHPGTHNMHICSDGDYYYTINGGIAEQGKISKFDKNGNLIREFPVNLDMRSIMYNNKDKSFYVSCYDKNIYKILDINSGAYAIKFQGLYSNDQAELALDHKGNELYYLDQGTLNIFDFNTGSLLNTYYNIKCGEGTWYGGAVVAVSKKNVFTWNSDLKEIYVYDKNLNLKGTFSIAEGDYGFSLSVADKLLFVSTDGDYETGTWYGYNLKDFK